MTWIIALAAGIALAAWSYLRADAAALAARVPLALLRALSLTLLVALLLNAPAGLSRSPSPLVALDVSQSWLRGGNRTAWTRARDMARRAAHDSLLLFGDSVRRGAPPELPADNATHIEPVVERALGSGRPVLLVTDGEVDEPTAVSALPAGSRVEVTRPPTMVDVGIVSLEAPRSAVAGDTVEIRVLLRTGDSTAPAGTLVVREDGSTLLSQTVDAMRAGEDRVLALRVPVGTAAGSHELATMITVPGDAEPRNDTLGVAIDVGRAVGAVVVSSSPDLDVRYVLPVLRGAVSLPTRAYFRVAPGVWREGGSLAAVAEGDVRRALHDAPIALLHGDTAIFGAPMSATTGALVLLAPPSSSDGEWYPVAAPASPLASALGGTPWDSLPPLDVAATVPPGDWEGLVTARGRRFDRRTAITGSEAPRRRVVVAASGLWRWHFRGGAGADAYAALWGSIFDWLAAERADPRAAFPSEGVLRAGEPVRWRRGGGAAAGDSAVTIFLRPRGSAGAREDSVVLHFGRSGMVAESAPLARGVYDVRVPRGSALLVVNSSRELLPGAPTMRAGSVGGAPPAGAAPPLRDAGWAYLLLLLSLCAEWLLRRRSGLR